MPTIRRAVYADCAALARIQVDSYRQAYAGLLPVEYLANFSYEEQTFEWQNILAGETDLILLVAEEEDKALSGYALGRIGPVEIADYDSELIGLHVRNTAQRQGVGRALISAMASEFQAAGARSLMLWVLVQNPARALYERLGGEPLGRRAINLGETGSGQQVIAEEIAYGWDDLSGLRRA